MQILQVYCIAVLTSVCATPLVAAAGAERPPNLIFVMPDDLGYDDLSCCGQKIIQTSWLGQIAAEKMRAIVKK